MMRSGKVACHDMKVHADTSLVYANTRQAREVMGCNHAKTDKSQKVYARCSKANI